MALVTTPDGRQVYLPDFVLPPQPQAFRAEDIQSPGAALPIPLPPGVPPPPPPPPPPPQKIGFSEALGSEISMPAPASVTSGTLPIGNPLETVPTPGAAPADVDVGFVPPAPPTAKEQAAAQKQAQRQAAFAASPEGQIQQAGAEQAAGSEAKADLARASGTLDVAAAEEANRTTQESAARAEAIRQETVRQEAERAAGIAERQKGYDAAVKSEADYKVDDNRRWNNLGTGKKVGFWIMAALSGLADALQHRNGPNMVVGMLKDTIQQDIAAQVREREQLGRRIGVAKNSLDTYMTATGNTLDAQRLKLSEEYDRLAQQIKASSARYAGDRARLAGEQMAVGFEQEAASLRGQVATQTFDRDVKRQQLAQERQRIGLQGAALSLQREEFKYRMKHDEDVLNAQAKELEAKGNVAQATAVREGAIGNAQPVIENGRPVLNPDGTPKMRADVMRNDDGTPWIMDKDTRKELAPVKASVDTITRVLDRVARNRTGWTSNTWNSPENAQLRADWEAALQSGRFLLQSGQLQGKEAEGIKQFLGTQDPTGWKDPKAGIAAARRNVLDIANDKFRAAGFAGTYAPPDLSKLEEPAETAADVELKRVMTVSGAPQTSRTFKGEKDIPTRVTSEQVKGAMRTVDAYGSQLKSRDASTAQLAADRLIKISNEAVNPEVRARARAMLEANLGAGEGPSAPSSATVRESVPLYAPSPRNL